MAKFCKSHHSTLNFNTWNIYLDDNVSKYHGNTPALSSYSHGTSNNKASSNFSFKKEPY